MDHAIFDTRKYLVLEVREGYTEWAGTYEQTVLDEMDLRLLEKVKCIDWSAQVQVLDLACGTGRIARWLRQHGNPVIDGVDITPAMLEAARGLNLYSTLKLASITDTGLPDRTYDLCIQSLADEHLPEVLPLYQEAARLVRPGGNFVLVGYHPVFLLMGIPTHFNRPSGEPVTIRSYVHLMSDHVKAAGAAGWTLVEMDEGLVDEAWLKKKPKWGSYRWMPVSFVMVWSRSKDI